MKRLFYLLFALSLTGVALAGSKEPPVPVRTVSPDYPDAMRHAGVSGVVTVNCLIDERGNVSEPKIEKSSHAAFERPAIDALKKWKFKPATEDGNAVSIRVSIPIKFICQG
jgi:protein TonB